MSAGPGAEFKPGPHLPIPPLVSLLLPEPSPASAGTSHHSTWMLLGAGAGLITLARKEHQGLGFLWVTMGDPNQQKALRAEKQSTFRIKGWAKPQKVV